MKIIIKREHAKGCSALRQVAAGRWSTPWALTGQVVRLDSIGRRNGFRIWTVAVCNSVRCTARAIALCSGIEDAIGDADPETVAARAEALGEGGGE